MSRKVILQGCPQGELAAV